MLREVRYPGQPCGFAGSARCRWGHGPHVVAILSGRCAAWTEPCVKSARVASPSARAGRGWVTRDRPAEIPAPGRCPAWPRPPAPGQSRAWCPPPGNGGSSGQLPARETRPRAAPVAACALLMPCEVRYAGQPCGFTGSARCRWEHGPRVVSVLPGRCAAWTAPGAGLARHRCPV